MVFGSKRQRLKTPKLAGLLDTEIDTGLLKSRYLDMTPNDPDRRCLESQGQVWKMFSRVEDFPSLSWGTEWHSRPMAPTQGLTTPGPQFNGL